LKEKKLEKLSLGNQMEVYICQVREVCISRTLEKVLLGMMSYIIKDGVCLPSKMGGVSLFFFNWRCFYSLKRYEQGEPFLLNVLGCG
jgi:hypothetical protein